MEISADALVLNYVEVLGCYLFFSGQGNFGDVMKGEYTRGRQKIPVAIKTLKHDDIPNAEVSECNMCDALQLCVYKFRSFFQHISICGNLLVIVVIKILHMMS